MPGWLLKTEWWMYFGQITCHITKFLTSINFFYGFFKMMPENEVEKLRKDAIVMHKSWWSC